MMFCIIDCRPQGSGILMKDLLLFLALQRVYQSNAIRALLPTIRALLPTRRYHTVAIRFVSSLTECLNV